MSYDYWLIGGVILAALELILPGGLSGALGVATLMVALLVYVGWLTTYPLAFGLWFVLSTLSLFVVRRVMRRLSPNQTSIGVVDHDETIVGTTAPVTDAIIPGQAGRILVGGTTWLATFIDPAASAPVGARVRLVSKTNITWIVAVIPPPSTEETP